MSGDTTQEKQIVLLYDDPVDQSAFKWHERVTAALEHLVSDKHARGRVIGLFGSWGSGKSTVIEMLLKALATRSKKENEDYKLFVFDAWAHSHDPLRRSFFEELRDFYVENRFTTKEEWEEDSNKLSRRQENASVKTTPVFESFGIILLLVYAGTIVFGGHFAANFIRDYFVESAKSQHTTSFIYLFYACAAFLWPVPFIVLMNFVSWTYAQACPKGPRIEKLKKWANVGSFFFKESQRIVDSKTIKTIDPTTIEFLEIFKKLVLRAQTSSAHKLVIVVDNIDRLPDEEVLTLWSTLRSFFTLRRNNKENSWVDNIWVVVPLDPLALERIFNKGNKANSMTSITGVTTPVIDKQSFDGFIEKTFHAIFWITPPVLADNQKYFVDQMQRVFGGKITNEECKEIFHIYETVRSGGDDQNTPRRIKSFLNQLGISFYLWKDYNIPLTTLAVYLLVQDKIARDLVSFLRQSGGSLVSTGLTTQHLIAMADADWKKHFAAIFYGVDPKDAVQVMARGELAQALSDGKIDEKYLEALSDTEAFYPVLECAVTDRCHVWSADYNLLTPVVNCLTSIEEFLGENASRISHLWEMVVRAVKDIDISGKIDGHGAIVLPYLIEKENALGRNYLAGQFLSRLLVYPGDRSPQGDDLEHVSDTLKDICGLLEAKNISLTATQMNSSSSQVKSSIFWPVLYNCGDNENTHFFFKSIIENSPNLEDDIQGLDQGDAPITSILYTGIKALYESGYKGKFQSAQNAFIASIRSLDFNQNIEDSLRGIAYMNHNWRRKDFNVAPAVENLFSDLVIYRVLASAHKDKRFDIVAACIALISQQDLERKNSQMQHDPIFTAAFQIRQNILATSIADDPLGTALLDVFKESFSFLQLVNKFASRKDYRAFAKSIFSAFIEEDVFLPSSTLIKDFKDFTAIIDGDEELEKVFLNYISGHTKLWEEMEKHNVVDDNLFDLCERIIAVGSQDAKGKCIACLASKLEALTEENWIEAFNAGSSDVRLRALRVLQDQGGNPEYGSDFRAALLKSLDILSESTEEVERNFYGSLPILLATSARKVLSKHATSEMLLLGRDKKIEALEKRLSLFPGLHTELGEITGDETSFATHTLIPLLDGGNIHSLIWMNDNKENLTAIYKAADKDTRQEIDSRLISLRLKASEQEKSTIEGIMGEWDIHIPSDPQNDDTGSKESKAQ